MPHFKLVFFVPKAHTGAVLARLFERFPRSVGRIGNYDQCAFVQRGTGQFRPLPGANPTIGKVEQLEYVEEDRVEVRVHVPDQEEHADADKRPSGPFGTLRETIAELKAAHPYEEVAYDVYRLEDV